MGTIVGQGKYKYRLVKNWAKIPPYFNLHDPVDMALDSKSKNQSNWNS